MRMVIFYFVRKGTPIKTNLGSELEFFALIRKQ